MLWKHLKSALLDLAVACHLGPKNGMVLPSGSFERNTVVEQQKKFFNHVVYFYSANDRSGQRSYLVHR